MPEHKQIPVEAADALTRFGAALWKHEDDDPTFLSMATYVGNGLFATVDDAGAMNHYGQAPYNDLRVHLLDGSGRILWIDWAVQSPVSPILFLKSETAESIPAPEVATMADVAAGEYARVYRVGFSNLLAGRKETAEAASDMRFEVFEGTVINDPSFCWFRNGVDEHARKQTIAAHCNFDYPGRSDLGAPVMDATGRLAGVMIGADLGPQCRDQGSYMPIEAIRPFGDMILSMKARRSGLGLSMYGRFDAVMHREEPEDTPAMGPR